MTVPAPLLSGHHAEIERWRKEQALERTRARRPDLLARPARGQEGALLEGDLEAKSARKKESEP